MSTGGSRATRNKQRSRSAKAKPASPGADNGSGAGVTTGGVLHDCLFFTANALARTITRMADEEFRPTGLSPSHAFLLMLVVERSGAPQKGLGESLQLAPSTVTRLVDTLVHRCLASRTNSGRTTTVLPTAKGRQLLPAIYEAWWRLHARYSAVLGKTSAEELTRRIDRARGDLEA